MVPVHGVAGGMGIALELRFTEEREALTQGGLRRLQPPVAARDQGAFFLAYAGAGCS